MALNDWVPPATSDHFFDLRIIESKHVPPGVMYKTDNYELLVHDAWTQVRLPIILSNLRKDLQKHLRSTLDEAIERLGLLSCEHPRATRVRNLPHCWWDLICDVCGEVVLRDVETDEELYRREETERGRAASYF